VDVHVSLIGRTGLTAEIYQQLRAAILDGRLRPGDALPPSREMARRLNVSRTTVTVAYDRLTGEGFAQTRTGAGTFVSPEVPRPSDKEAPARDALRPRPVWASIPGPRAFVLPAELDFRTGLTDSSSFNYETWRRLTARELQASVVGKAVPGDPAGHPALRRAIARHIGTSRGIEAGPEAVTVTNGTQQALDLVARVLVAPGETVAVEDPGYQPPRLLFESHGLRVAGVPVDDEGLVVDQLPADVRLVYVTPSHQYPLGMAMSLPRRIALLEWAERHDAAVIEDDYDSEFRYGGRPIEPLHTLDRSGRVIYVGSLSKSMLPTLRLGFVVTPPPLHDAVHSAKFVTDWHTPLPAQGALARFIDEGWLARHVRKMRNVYRERHQTLLEGLAAELAGDLAVVPSAAGLHVSALATRLSVDQVEEVARRAQAAGVGLQRLSWFRVERPPLAGFAIGYGGITADRIGEGLRRVRQAFEQVNASAGHEVDSSHSSNVGPASTAPGPGSRPPDS
jgi:GntR family transcriptional regulator/MocR family aminotransferase